MGVARTRVRVRLSAAERSDLVADQIALALDRRPSTLSLRAALEIIAERAIQIRDDLNDRNPKCRTWVRTQKVRSQDGHLVTELPLSEDARRKMVASTIGSMLVAQIRYTAPWVMDAVDEALGYLPWAAR